MENVYISCAPKDAAAAQRFCSELEARGFGCCISIAEPSAGPVSADQIPPALLLARFYVPLVSRHSLSSAVMKNELYWATEENISIFPVHLDKAPLNDTFLFYLGTRQWISAKRNLGPAVRKLCSVLCDELDPQQKHTHDLPEGFDKSDKKLIFRLLLCVVCVLAYMIATSILSSQLQKTNFSLYWNIDGILGLVMGVSVILIMAPAMGGYKVFLRTIAEKLRDALRGK